MGFYSGRRVLVTGGTGLIGRPLVESLVALGAKVKVVSLDDRSRCPEGGEYEQLDLRSYDNCYRACHGAEIVFNLIGIKGSPRMMKEKPASYFVPSMLFNTNMMAAAYAARVERYLFTSSIGVYAPAEVFKEEDVWKTFPSPNDRFAGWAKRMGELQADAYRIEFGWKGISIVRPANVYGPFDNFDPENAMVIPSLIRRAVSGEDPFVVWGDGSEVRDFIYSGDCAEAILLVVERGYNEPVNIGSGTRRTIADVANAIVNRIPKRPELKWDVSKGGGDKIRVMDTTRLASLGFSCSTSLEEGISKTIDWYLAHQDVSDKRYNVWRDSGATTPLGRSLL